jgi:hypothetical protein
VQDRKLPRLAFLWLLVTAPLIGLALPLRTEQERRVALMSGDTDDRLVPKLSNPANDAADIGAAPIT